MRTMYTVLEEQVVVTQTVVNSWMFRVFVFCYMFEDVRFENLTVEHPCGVVDGEDFDCDVFSRIRFASKRNYTSMNA